MEIKNYPIQAFFLTPGYAIKEITVIGKACEYGGYDEWHKAEGGKQVNEKSLYASRKDAIDAGRVLLAAQKADIAKRTATMDKRAVALDKAEQSTWVAAAEAPGRGSSSAPRARTPKR